MAIDARAHAALLAALLTLAACATDPTPDLAAFLERRATCDHLRGEIPDQPDAALLREIDRACGGTDAQLVALKKRYRDDPVVTRQLADFEPQIEAK
jgi:hypothetical protein